MLGWADLFNSEVTSNAINFTFLYYANSRYAINNCKRYTYINGFDNATVNTLYNYLCLQINITCFLFTFFISVEGDVLMMRGLCASSLASVRLVVLLFLDLSLPLLLRECCSSGVLDSLTGLSLSLIRQLDWVSSGSAGFSWLLKMLFSSPDPSNNLARRFLGVVGAAGLATSARVKKLHSPTDRQHSLHLEGQQNIGSDQNLSQTTKITIFLGGKDHGGSSHVK